jgi:O-acetyl-ADP-ribose deacetylase (regulator of RNase III)
MGNDMGNGCEVITVSTAILAPTVVVGDATDPVGDGPRIIAHVCNNLGRWGRGFVLALSKRWAEPEQAYRRWWNQRNSTHLPLGHVQLVPVAAGELWVANMIGQHGIHGSDGKPPIRYPAVRQCLEELAVQALARGASVHMPRIGCGLAGGEWSRISPLVKAALCERGVPVTVYDLPGTERRGRPRSNQRGTRTAGQRGNW